MKYHSLILQPILRKSAVVIFRQQFKTFDSNTFALSSMLSFQNVWPMIRKAVYILAHFQIFIHYLDQIESQLAYIFKTTYSILVNLCFRR